MGCAFAFSINRIASFLNMPQSSMATETPAPAVQQSNRNLYAFGTTSLLNDTASEMAYWVLPAFIISLGADAGQLGIIEGIAECVASLFKLFSGLLTDRVVRRKPIVVMQ